MSNTVIFETKNGETITKTLNEGAWFHNLAEARRLMNSSIDIVNLRLMGRPWPHWSEQVITSESKKEGAGND